MEFTAAATRRNLSGENDQTWANKQQRSRKKMTQAEGEMKGRREGDNTAGKETYKRH